MAYVLRHCGVRSLPATLMTSHILAGIADAVCLKSTITNK
jgi:hypothetical protein